MSRDQRMPLLTIAFPVFDPVAFSIGPFVVRWYALAYIGASCWGGFTRGR